jgi:hypothetical protein
VFRRKKTGRSRLIQHLEITAVVVKEPDVVKNWSLKWLGIETPTLSGKTPDENISDWPAVNTFC